MIAHVLSGWLASSYPIRRAFLQHISWRVSVESVINKRKSSCHRRMKEWLDCWMFVHPTEYGGDIGLKGFLISQKLFLSSLSTSEYHHYYQGGKWNMPEFLKPPNNSLSKVYRFIWSCRFVFLDWTWFFHLAALVCFLAVVPFVIFRILLQQLQEKKNKQLKIFFRAQCETLRVDWRNTRGNFTRKPTDVNFPSADWLSYLRTQLTVFVGRVCLRSRKIFSALFSRNNFFTRRGHFKELQVKGNLFNCSQILTVASFAYKQQKRVISKYFFFKSDFCTINSHFLNPISKMFRNFSLKLNMANRRHVFLALWPRKRRNTLNKQKTKFALTGNAQKVI